MDTLEGSKAIESWLLDRKAKAFDALRKRVEGVEGKALAITLEALQVYGSNLTIESVGNSFIRTSTDLHFGLRAFRFILDALLEMGYRNIEPFSDSDFWSIFPKHLASLDLAKYANLLDIQRTYPARKATVDKDEIHDMEDEGFYNAVRRWVDNASSDPEYENWYYGRHKHGVELRLILEQEFKDTFKLDLTDLDNINAYLERLSLDYVNKGRPTLFPLKLCKEIRDVFSKNMSKTRCIAWLRELEYRPGRSLYKSPLIPLISHGRNVYYIACWSFTPSDHFYNYWISEVLLKPESKAAKIWGQKYGDAFEKYVSKVVAEANLPVRDLGSLAVSRVEHPEISEWLDRMRKDGFEVDRIFLTSKTAYIVSCKADFILDRKLAIRDLFFPTKDTKAKISKNIFDMREIFYETECIRAHPSIVEDRTHELLEGKTIQPILVTNRLQPIEVPEVREYYARLERFPDVPVKTTKEFVSILRCNCSGELDQSGLIGRHARDI